MGGYREPCMCGAPDCVRCYGESARYYGWCDECEYSESGECNPDEVSPGSFHCKKKDDVDDAMVERYQASHDEEENHG